MRNRLQSLHRLYQPGLTKKGGPISVAPEKVSPTNRVERIVWRPTSAVRTQIGKALPDGAIASEIDGATLEILEQAYSCTSTEIAKATGQCA